MNTKPFFSFLLVSAFLAMNISCNPGSGNFLPSVSSDSTAKKQALNISAYTAVVNFDKELTAAQLRNAYWVETQAQSEEKTKQREFLNTGIEKINADLFVLSNSWPEENKKKLQEILSQSEQLFTIYRDNMKTLAEFSDYEDPAKMLPAKSITFDSDGDCMVKYRQIRKELDELEEKLSRDAMNSSGN